MILLNLVRYINILAARNSRHGQLPTRLPMSRRQKPSVFTLPKACSQVFSGSSRPSLIRNKLARSVHFSNMALSGVRLGTCSGMHPMRAPLHTGGHLKLSFPVRPSLRVRTARWDRRFLGTPSRLASKTGMPFSYLPNLQPVPSEIRDPTTPRAQNSRSTASDDDRDVPVRVNWLLCLFCPTGRRFFRDRSGQAKTPCAALARYSLHVS